jgi:hypothetical protein
MKRIVFILTLLTFLTGCGNSQTNNSTTQLTGDIGTDLKNLIPKGKHIADIMDGVRQNPRQATLTKKFQNGIKNNYEWFVEYMKPVPEGEPMPYHAKLGMTKEEYDELMGYLNNIEIVSTGKENIEVEIKNDTIYFKSQGKLSDYDSLKIDLKGNTVLFGQYIMPFSDTSNITNDKNGLRSKWKGYTWKFEEPNDLNLDDLKDLSNLKMKQYKFTIGRLEKNGKTYMSLKGREIEDGEKTVEFELPVIF